MHILILLAFAPIILITRYVLSLLYLTYTTRTLQSIPGPFWARFTRFWYFRRLWNGHFEDDNIRLHNQYGPIVRIAPDHYSINDRAALKTIYGTGTKFAKAAWYEGWKHPDPQRWTLFPDRDIKRHGWLLSSFFWSLVRVSANLITFVTGETRKRFSSLYSMSSLVHYEEFVDQCADVFFQRLSEFAERDAKFNLGEWLQFYAFDVIGEITYGQRFGELGHT